MMFLIINFWLKYHFVFTTECLRQLKLFLEKNNFISMFSYCLKLMHKLILQICNLRNNKTNCNVNSLINLVFQDWPELRSRFHMYHRHLGCRLPVVDLMQIPWTLELQTGPEYPLISSSLWRQTEPFSQELKQIVHISVITFDTECCRAWYLCWIWTLSLFDGDIVIFLFFPHFPHP